ncbi:DUF3794 domain-containing protein [Clostridium sp. CCUG 7971]|uniref:DUF3794 domain-containing protein n=1 Tax=Clostridium sp. CCUG 7971 TaxID=2811414 RepID=UPI001ABB0EA4|nr:DUF3794 domain-containing protein [Clostridium sp. CCUG 7971]MBO3445730.1 DUF3794 domain-containing protein [Clostridium sp. CCUG 7971]
MPCNCNSNASKGCGCDFNVRTIGVSDVSNVTFAGNDRTALNWTEISVPEILCVPEQKPNIENLDQVYVNIELDSVNLIETPFAYRRYVLFSFFEAASGITSAILTPLITAINTTVAAVITPLNTITPLLNTLLTTLGTLVAVPGVPALITTVQGMVTTVNTLITSINTATTAVANAADNLIAAIIAVPFSPDLICAALQALIEALNTLTTVINSILGILTAMLNTLTAAAAAIGNVAVTTAVGLVTTALTTLINTTLPPLIAAVIAAITAVLDILAPVDCTQAYAIAIIPNAEGTCLSGRKLIIEGTLKQKVVYTAEVETQSVHSAHYEIPFSAFIIPYANFEGLTYQEGIEVYDPTNPTVPLVINGFIVGSNQVIEPDLCEEFNIDTYIEDVFIYALDPRTIFKNVTVFLRARVATVCS